MAMAGQSGIRPGTAGHTGSQSTMENNDGLKQRLVGAAVLISLIVVFLPMLVDDGPGPSPDRPAVPKTPAWKFSGWKGDPYQTPEQPQRTQVEAIDPGAVSSTATQQHAARNDDGAGPESTRRSAGHPPGDLLEATVKDGDTLYGIFRRLGLDSAEAREVVKLSSVREPLSRLRPGQRFRIRVDADKHILAMEYLPGSGLPLRIERIGGRLQNVTATRQAGGAQQSASHSPRASAKAVTSSKSAQAVSKTPRPDPSQGPVAWAVQVGVYKNWDAARGVQSTLRSKGYPAFLKARERDGAKLWHLKVGPQLKKREAIALARKIQQETGNKTQVVGYP